MVFTQSLCSLPEAKLLEKGLTDYLSQEPDSKPTYRGNKKVSGQHAIHQINEEEMTLTETLFKWGNGIVSVALT